MLSKLLNPSSDPLDTLASSRHRPNSPRPWRLLLTILAIIFASEAIVMLILPWIVPRDFGYLAEVFVDSFLLTSVLAPLLWWIVIVPLRQLVETRLQLLHRVFTVQEEERGRIARDLHDGLGQSMTSLLVRMRAIEQATTDEKVLGQIRDVRQLGSDAYDQIRQISRGLRPTALDDFGLAPAIERYLEEATIGRSIRITTDLASVADKRLPEIVETNLYRVIQEATSNALKHGKPNQISLTFELHDGALEVEFRDNGGGFEPVETDKLAGAESQFGLWSMRERMAAMAGTMRVESRKGEGTIIGLHVPRTSLVNHDATDSNTHRG